MGAASGFGIGYEEIKIETTWYNKLPKVELHVHLEGAIPHEALFELVRKYGGDPSVPDLAAIGKRFKYRDFSGFLEAWTWKNQFLREYEDFSHVAELTARDMAGQNIRYAELFFSPSLFIGQGIEVQKIAQAVRSGLSKVSQIEIALIADLVRDYGPASEMATLKKLEEVKSAGVIGIGIGGSEHRYPPAFFSRLYEEARRMGFHTTAHAGEAVGPRSVWDAIRHLHVDRIGHATRAQEDPELLDYIEKHAIPLELCPTSNILTGSAASIAEHPVRDYFKRGLIVSVNTDDPKMFGITLAEEYRRLVNECGFSRNDIRSLVLSAVQSSWLPEERKMSLTESFIEDASWL